MTPTAIAHALGGVVSRGAVLAPGPGHSKADRSLSVRPSPDSPTGFVVFSHAGDDWQLCRDFVAQRLGIDSREGRTLRRREVSPADLPRRREVLIDDTEARIARAVSIWSEAVYPRGTIVERYLGSRGLELDDVVAGDALRYHPACPWREGEVTVRVPAMVAAMRCVTTDRIKAVHRTRLTADGRKVDRRMLGPAAGCAVKLDPDDAVTMGLTIGEGIETCLAARQLGFRPVWALASAGAIAAFPVLSGLEALTVLAEHDPTSERAVANCGARWTAAGREVSITAPQTGSDLNDSLRSAA